MPVPTLISELSTTAASNSPQGAESIGGNMDDYLRAAYAFIKQLEDGKLSKSGGTLTGPLTGSSASFSGNVEICTTGGSLEIGRVDGFASTPVIDFHSGATAVDYDVRIIASGGTGSVGGGTLNVTAGFTQLNCATLVHDGNKAIFRSEVLVDTEASFWGIAGRGLLELNGTTSGALLGFKINDAGRAYLYHNGTALNLVTLGADAFSLSTNAVERLNIHATTGAATFSGSVAAASFNGPLTGNASSATTASSTTAALTAGAGLTAAGTFNGSAARTFSIASTSNGFGTRTVSASAPSGGSNGDIWYRT